MKKLAILFVVLILAGLAALLFWLSPSDTQNKHTAQPDTTTPPVQPEPTATAQPEPSVPAEKPIESPDAAPAQATQTDNTHSDVKKHTHTPADKAMELLPETGLPADKNDPMILAKRQQVFQDLSDISVNMGQGIRPEPEQVTTLAADIKHLVTIGYLPKEDAAAQLQFLQNVFPNVEIQ